MTAMAIIVLSQLLIRRIKEATEQLFYALWPQLGQGRCKFFPNTFYDAEIVQFATLPRIKEVTPHLHKYIAKHQVWASKLGLSREEEERESFVGQ